MSVLGVGQAGGAALAALSSGGNQDVAVTMLRKALDASTSTVAPLLASLPQASGPLGGTLDVRM